MVTRPTWLFGLGAQKAGTTWLHAYFRQHPQIHVPACKEMHYFDALWLPRSAGFADRRRKRLREMEAQNSPDLAELRALVRMHDAPEGDHSAYLEALTQGRTDEACVADLTPSYCNLGAEHLQLLVKDFAPAKLLFVMRDPVQRMWSQIRMQCEAGSAEATSAAADRMIAQMVAGRGQVIWQRSDMAATLKRLRALPAEQVKVMYYETLFEEAQIKALCDFMQVDYVEAPLEKRVRAGKTLMMTQAQHATLRWLNGPSYRAIHRLEGAAIPEAWDMDAQTAIRPEALMGSEIDEQNLQGRTR